MMNDFERYSEYNQIEDGAEAWKKRFDGFMTKLPVVLCEFFFAYWPEMEASRPVVEADLKELAVYPTREAYFAYLSVKNNQAKGESPANDYGLPKRKSKEEAESYLQKRLSEFPQLKDNEKYIQSYWRNFDVELKYENFFFGVHNKIKEVLVEFYLQGIDQFEGEHLRRIDSDLYYLSSYEFARRALKLKSQIEEQNENQ